jgi:glycine dehydrogenase subunit 2
MCEITGMSRATLQPPAGACGEMTGLLIMRAFHAEQGSVRTKVVIPDSAHGTNPASVALAGFQAVPVPSDPRGLVDADALEKLCDEDVAGLMLTNPNTLGLFETDIVRITEIVHAAGGLVYYDGANLNAILGRCRPGDMGFDIVHINTHKTFATPHGGGGPGAGPVGVVDRLVPFLPSPTVERAGDGFVLDHDRPRSIGRMHGFHGNVGVLVRAYAYVFAHGGDGLKAVSERAALNANYLLSLIAEAYPPAYPGRPMHEFVATRSGAEGPLRRPSDGRGEADHRPGLPSLHGVLPVGGGGGHDDGAHRDRDEGDPRGLRGRPPPGRGRGRHRPELLHEAPVTTPVRRLDEARAARHLKLRW